MSRITPVKQSKSPFSSPSLTRNNFLRLDDTNNAITSADKTSRRAVYIYICMCVRLSLRVYTYTPSGSRVTSFQRAKIASPFFSLSSSAARPSAILSPDAVLHGIRIKSKRGCVFLFFFFLLLYIPRASIADCRAPRLFLYSRQVF